MENKTKRFMNLSIMDNSNVLGMVFSKKDVYCLNLGTIDEDSEDYCLREVHFFPLKNIPLRIIQELIRNDSNLFFFDFEGKANKYSKYGIRNIEVIPTLLFNNNADLWVLTGANSLPEFVSLGEFTASQVKKLINDTRNFFFCLPD